MYVGSYGDTTNITLILIFNIFKIINKKNMKSLTLYLFGR